jgi:diguanylate cyclase (GGDEF)-like protein
MSFELVFPMKRLIASIAVLLGAAASAWAVPPALLTSLHAVHILTNAEANRGFSVAFEATVTYSQPKLSTLFVQEGGEGLYIAGNLNAELLPGDRVLVRGKTQGSLRPIVASKSVMVLHHGQLPKAVPSTYDDLIHIRHDSVLVTVRGIVRTADFLEQSDNNSAYLLMLTPDGYVWAIVDHYLADQLPKLLDAEVEITGVSGGLFDGKMQMRGVQLSVCSPAGVKVLRRANTSPWSLPVTPMDQIIAGYHVADHTNRIRVHGTITYYLPEIAVVLQDGAKSLWISTRTHDPMHVGDIVDATGFPEEHNGFLALAHGEILDSRVQAPVAPQATTRTELTTSRHIIDLVSVEGQVVTAARGGSQDAYELTADGQLFSAIYRHPPNRTPLPMKHIPIGSRIRVTGVCLLEGTNPFNVTMEVPFNILMRDFEDITVVANPSPINTRNLILAVIVLLLAVIAVGGWGWVLMKKVHRQTVVMAARTETEAAMERRRSSILMDINGSRPLTDIMKQIVEMVSFGLKGAPCWCRLADGANFGERPCDENALRVLQKWIAGRSGAMLGTLFAGLDPALPARESDSEVLASGVRLATLAIETRRLYADLRRRSEYDLLTDIPNRFAMDKRLDTLIEDARQHSGAFGLIYIDLDRFKPINDRYGHHIGDLFLQAVAERMARQLRGGDMLARLGGDEFAALVSMARNRQDVEEAADRLERCFNEPFAVNEYLLPGAVSLGIALFPVDGATKDSLLTAADAAMYVVKNNKKQLGSAVA